MMKRVKVSLNDGGSVRALLWFQGESDTVSLRDAQSYQTRVHKFFLDVRNDLQSPLLPIIQVFFFSLLVQSIIICYDTFYHAEIIRRDVYGGIF
jgi:hypothetical protein